MGSQSELEFLRSKNLELQSTLDSVSEAYRNASQMREEFRQENVDLKNKNRLLQESVNRLQEACFQYETDLDEARNLAEIYKEERDKFYGQLEQAREYRDKIQVATGHKGVVDVNVNGEVVIKINVK